MTASKHVTLWCDHVEELFPFRKCTQLLELGMDSTVRGARETARDEGWYSTRGGRDYCPRHKPWKLS